MWFCFIQPGHIWAYLRTQHNIWSLFMELKTLILWFNKPFVTKRIIHLLKYHMTLRMFMFVVAKSILFKNPCFIRIVFKWLKCSHVKILVKIFQPWNKCHYWNKLMATLCSLGSDFSRKCCMDVDCGYRCKLKNMTLLHRAVALWFQTFESCCTPVSKN